MPLKQTCILSKEPYVASGSFSRQYESLEGKQSMFLRAHWALLWVYGVPWGVCRAVRRSWESKQDSLEGE